MFRSAAFFFAACSVDEYFYEHRACETRTQRETKETNANYSSRNTSAVIDRSSPDLALQRRLGILSERWLGADPADPAAGSSAWVTKLFLMRPAGHSAAEAAVPTFLDAFHVPHAFLLA
jgi:hypothetical protein